MYIEQIIFLYNKKTKKKKRYRPTIERERKKEDNQTYRCRNENNADSFICFL